MTCGRPAAAKEGGIADRIRRDLEHNILSGMWAPGQRIPSEQELCLMYACSRMTVSKAVGRLVASGQLERNRRAGTIVRRPQLQSGVSEIVDIGHEIENRGEHYSYRCLRHRADHTRNRLDILCLHLAGGKPLVLEDRLINLTTVHEADHVNFETIAPGRWLIENVAWTEARHKVSAAISDNDTAGWLQIASGEPCLIIERETFFLEQQITRVRQVFRGDSYSLASRFTPSGG